MSRTPTTSISRPTSEDDQTLGRRVLVVAPFGRDAVEICRILTNAGVDSECFTDVRAACREIGRGASAILVAEEALNNESRARLSATLNEQPDWSDFPVLIMTSRSRGHGDEWQALRGIEGTAHLTLLERPLHVSTLVISVQTATQARERQYQIRDALAARHRAESELQQLNRTLEVRVRERTADLEARNRDLRNFAYVASHDLREPLRKIQTFVDLVLEEESQALGQDARVFLERMAAAAARMDTLLNDLLVFSRVGTHDEPKTSVRLGDVIDEVLTDFDLAIRDMDADIDVDADVTIEADRPQLRQLMTNLIGNALKFHLPGSAPRLRIRAAVIADEAEPGSSAGSAPLCRITVEDTGVGFDLKFADRVFEPFERLHAQDAYEGTGMGLAICKRIVQVHGGTITAESTPGEGSRFIILLPVRQPSGEHVATGASGK